MRGSQWCSGEWDIGAALVFRKMPAPLSSSEWDIGAAAVMWSVRKLLGSLSGNKGRYGAAALNHLQRRRGGQHSMHLSSAGGTCVCKSMHAGLAAHERAVSVGCAYGQPPCLVGYVQETVSVEGQAGCMEAGCMEAGCMEWQAGCMEWLAVHVYGGQQALSRAAGGRGATGCKQAKVD